ncbi:MAG: T9SS type A sorting domain-containing protein, partial [Bacteroidota bacterium]
GYIEVGRDLTINSTGILNQSGDMLVREDLVLNGTINGPATGTDYGTIRVTEQSTINGSGTVTGNTDICDLGYPPGGLDTNFGTVGSSTTFCVNQPAGSVLPIELLSFTASRTGDQIALDWSTSRETGNDFFVVERRGASEDTFTLIGIKPGAGYSTSVRTYNFLDSSPPAQRVLYRLKQVDFNGKFSYSSTIEIGLSRENEASINLFPNPASATLTVQIKAPQPSSAQIELIDLQGQSLSTTIVPIQSGQAQSTLLLADLSSGVYFVRARLSDGRPIGPVQRFVKR